MDHTYWQIQKSDEPLFPDILWSRPESKQGAGKLAIVGGNGHGFSAVGIAYNAAINSGAGYVKVLLPDAIRKVVRTLLPDAEFTPSTPSGSFNKLSLDQFLSIGSWSDCTLLAGDIGRNSETAIVLERFLAKYSGPVTITQDGLDYFKEIPLNVVNRDNTLVVASLSQLQKMFIHTPTITPITLSMSTPQLAEALHVYTLEHPATIITKHNDLLFVAGLGKVSTTKHEDKIWRVEIAAKASVFWMQNPKMPFEAATTALFR